jgi:squalene-associated FAD-dependent desaturase
LNWSERYSAIRFFIQLKLINFKLDQDIPLNDLLKRFKQPNNLIKYVWEPLCLAALNTPITTASAQTYLNVLKDSFNQKKTDSDLLLPRHDLSRLLAEPLADFIKSHQGTIKLNSQVKQLGKANHDFLVNGSHFTHVILAVAPFRLAGLTERLERFLANDLVSKFTYEPIYTVYLQYPSDVKLPQVMIGLTHSTSQWIFDRGQLNGQKGLLAVIISANGKHQKLSQEALANEVIRELKSTFSNLPPPKWHKVIAEKRATFACTANLERPQQKTGIQNLYLAGDYTEGNYPATIEGAIQSGVSAAQLILQS